MTDEENGVVPETQIAEQSNLLSLSDIAEAAGLESIFENASSEITEEVADEVIEEEGEAEYSDEPEAEINESETPPDTQPEGVKKRIGKLIEARELAKAETEQLREELEKLKGVPPVKTEQQGLKRFDEVTSLSDLERRESDAEHLREWLLANPDGGDYEDSSGTEHEVDYDQAKKLIVETDRDLRKNIPSVKNRLVMKGNQEQVALKTFQWMSDQTSPESLELKAILAENEYLSDYSTRDPFAKIVLGYAVEGFKKMQSKPTSTPATLAPNIPNAPSRAKPSVVKGKQGNSKADLLKLAASGDIDDASKYIESLL